MIFNGSFTIIQIKIAVMREINDRGFVRCGAIGIDKIIIIIQFKTNIYLQITGETFFSVRAVIS